MESLNHDFLGISCRLPRMPGGEVAAASDGSSLEVRRRQAGSHSCCPSVVFLDILVTEQAQRRASSWVWMCNALCRDNVRRWVDGWMDEWTDRKEEEEEKGMKETGKDGWMSDG